MTFTVPNGTSYIDLGLAASIANRRGYSQQVLFPVDRMEFYTSAPGNFTVSKLPDTWMMRAAYEKTRALWNKMNDQVLDDEPSIKGKYHDFKILMDIGQSTATVETSSNLAGTILTPRDAGGNLTNADYALPGVSPRADWVYSQLTLPNDPTSGVTTDYTIHAVGPDTPASKGVIQGYAQSRSRPQSQDPNVPTNSGWMTELFDVGEQLEELRDIIEEDNDRPPYAVSPEQTANNFYPGGAQEFPGLQLHAFETVSTTTVGGRTVAPGGVFMCGLMKIENTTGAGANLILQLVPGYHRGYLCEEL